MAQPLSWSMRSTASSRVVHTLTLHGSPFAFREEGDLGCPGDRPHHRLFGEMPLYVAGIPHHLELIQVRRCRGEVCRFKAVNPAFEGEVAALQGIHPGIPQLIVVKGRQYLAHLSAHAE